MSISFLIYVVIINVACFCVSVSANLWAVWLYHHNSDGSSCCTAIITGTGDCQ